jgi:SAM-dependent methyltransferase
VSGGIVLRLNATELAMRGWLMGARLLARRRPRRDVSADREQLVRRLAPGGSFLDVGGMWNVYGRIAFTAEEAGASPVAIFDVMDPVDPFQEEHARRGSDVRYVTGDLHDPISVAEMGVFDTVWCTGILYHTPNPLGQLVHLRRLTRRHLVLGTHVIPELPGLPNACLFYPHAPEAARRAFAAAHGDRDGALVGVTAPFRDGLENTYVNWWFGITPSALRGMLATAHFEVVEEHRYSPWMLDVVVRPVGDEPEIPDPAIFREIHAKRVELLGPDLPAWLKPL